MVDCSRAIEEPHSKVPLVHPWLCFTPTLISQAALLWNKFSVYMKVLQTCHVSKYVKKLLQLHRGWRSFCWFPILLNLWTKGSSASKTYSKMHEEGCLKRRDPFLNRISKQLFLTMCRYVCLILHLKGQRYGRSRNLGAALIENIFSQHC